PETLLALTAALRSVGARLAAAAAGQASQPVVEPGVREAIDRIVDRPAAPTAKQRAELQLMNDIERLGRIVDRIAAELPLEVVERSVAERATSAAATLADALERSAVVAKAEVRGEAGWQQPFSIGARLLAVLDSAEEHVERLLAPAHEPGRD